MCRTTNCENIYINLINKASESIYCAFFDFDLENINNAIKKKNKEIKRLIFVDKDNNFFNESYIIYDNRSSYMHNKFCIIDDELLITGSFNPTINGRDKNDNNIIIIKSKTIADIYNKYFFELIKEHNTKKRSNMTKNYQLNFNNTNISICFSRGGKCLEIIKNEIKKANKSIYLMMFTATDKSIADYILIKHYSNISIHAIFERSLITKYSIFHKLTFHKVRPIKDCNKAKLHHKVIIIDNNIVITGSLNPSHNADTNNDENMIVIENPIIAEKYLNEFTRVTDICMTS